MKLLKYVSFLCLSWMLLLGCSTTEENYTNIKKYYYPLDSLTNGGKVYEYRPVLNDGLEAGSSDSVLSNYSKLEYFPNQDMPVLVSTIYDAFCRQSGIYRDEIVKSGALQIGVKLLEYPNEMTDTAIGTDGKIGAANIYPFEVRDSSAYAYELSWKSGLDTNGKVNIKRVRRFKGFTSYSYKGKTLECVEFEVQERLLYQHSLDGDLSREYTKVERFAEGIGLVYYTLFNPLNEETTAYELLDIYEMDQLIEKCEQLFFGDYPR